jgi:hypothetical protein
MEEAPAGTTEASHQKGRRCSDTPEAAITLLPSARGPPPRRVALVNG